MRLIAYPKFLTSAAKLSFACVDPIYNSYLYLKFINRLLSKGRKHKLELILHRVFTRISQSIKIPFIFLIVLLLTQSFLPLDLVKKKKGRRVYLIPVPVKYSRLYAIVFGHVASNFKKKKTKINKVSTFMSFFHQSLFNKTNSFATRRKLLIKQVLDNRAFKHFR